MVRIQRQLNYTLHKPARYNFLANRVIVTETDDQWQEDLMEIGS